jgi:hypothetical protein
MNTYQFPTTSNDTNRAWVRFKAVNYVWSANDTENRLVKRPGDTVYLYLPGSIQVSDGASYANTDLGIIGSNVESAIESGALAGNSARIGDMLEFGGQMWSDIVRTGSEVMGGGNVNPAMLIKVMQKTRLSGTPVGQGLRAGTRMTTNPHVRALFENVGLRSFSFEFDMVPNNEAEARAVQEIVKFFRTALYPSYAGSEEEEQAAVTDRSGVSGLRGFVYQYPPKIQVDMFYEMKSYNARLLQLARQTDGGIPEIGGDGIDSTTLNTDAVTTLVRVGPKLLPMHLTAVNTTYDSAGAFAFRPDGTPVSTKISVSLSEDRTLVANDIRRGY